MRNFFLAALSLLLLSAARPALPHDSAKSVSSTPAASRLETMRGVTISTHRGGQEWASDMMAPALAEIQQLGSTWVAIHPYGWIQADGTVKFRPFDPAHPPEHILRPIREAHALGLKILIKPHLGYWGSPFRWRGEIEFKNEASWRRFWESYRSWIVQVASVAHEADGFVVGTELDRTLEFDKEWRSIIAGVRKQTKAPLTYAANWSDYQRVGFWDALDTIGIQAYFPVTEATNPSAAELRRGWTQSMKKLSAFSAVHDRPIIFTELGYNRSFTAAARPWEYHTDGPEAETFQRACLTAALEAVEREPRVVGVFLWKWFPGPRPAGHNFQLATPGMRQAIREVWAG